MTMARQQGGSWVNTSQEALSRVPPLNTLPFVRDLVAPRRRAEEEVLSRPNLSAPRTSFNRPITAHRRVAFGSVPFGDIKVVKSRFGMTVNDVVMAVCAGGLRQWLTDHHELPTSPLLAMTPVSIRADDRGGAGDQVAGNQVSGMIAALPTNEADPRRRLQLAHEAMKIAKEQHKAMPANLLADLANFSPPGLAALAARTLSRFRVADLTNPPYNVTISNVPGPQQPLYLAGHKQTAMYPVSIVTDGLGLNITVVSYDGQLHFGLIACRELVPDLWALMDHLVTSVAELRALAG